MLDNYDTNLHLKHAEHLAGCCTVAVIKEGGGGREESSTDYYRLQRTDTGGYWHQDLSTRGRIFAFTSTRAPLKICTKRISRRDHFTCFHTAPRLWRIPPLIFLQQIQIWNFILSFISCCNLSDKQARVSANEVSRRTGIKLISLHEKLNTFKKQFSGLNWAGRPPWVNYTTYF